MKALTLILGISFLTSLASAETKTIICAFVGQQICTMEYAPATCRYEDYQAPGSNACVAMGRLEMALCANTTQDTLEIDTDKLTCSPKQQ